MFNLPIYVPFQDVALLANNQSFQDINIIAGTMASGQSLSLVPIGTVSTASLVYIFQGNFTVGTGATLTVGTGTSVLIDPVTITDNGAMNVTGASIGFVAGYSATTQILVNGTLSRAAPTSTSPAATMHPSHSSRSTPAASSPPAPQLSPQRAEPGQRQHLQHGRPHQRHLQLADLRAVPGRRTAGQQPELPGHRDYRRKHGQRSDASRWSRSERSRRPASSISSRATSPSVREQR